MIIATYDVGTTAVKGVLLDSEGTVLASKSVDIHTITEGGAKEQDPEEWYTAFRAIARHFSEMIPQSVDAVIMSGQMQDVIPVGSGGRCVGPAILYSDGRASDESREIISRIGEEKLREITGNHYDGSLSLPKILWLKKNRPDIYDSAAFFLISAKDYIIFRLTGKAAGDYTACSTAGAMDLRKGCWSREILDAAGVDAARMPELFYPCGKAGYVREEEGAGLGMDGHTAVYAGIGDAGATTLASGISGEGELNINLGTSGWVAAISRGTLDGTDGVFNLAAFDEGLVINVVPFLNGGNVHRWVSGLFASKEDGSVDYESAEQLLKKSPAGSRGVMFLPYLCGERFPVMDADVRGTYAGITGETDRSDMIRSCLEGVAFSIRQGIGQMKIRPEKISVIGGGGRVAAWNRIMADVLGHEVLVYPNSDTLPALALSSAVLLDQGRIRSYREYIEELQPRLNMQVFAPDAADAETYDRVYRKYLKLYPSVRDFYTSIL